MAAYTLTPASVKISTAQGNLIYGQFGETVNAGQPVCRHPSNTDDRGAPTIVLADANDADLYNVIGLAVNSGYAGSEAVICTEDPTFTHGLATVAAGDVIILGGTPGSLHPSTDLASGWYPVVVLIGRSATGSVLKPLVGTVAKS